MRTPLVLTADEPSDPARDTWEAYASAYWERWGTEPLRGAKVNAIIKSIVRQVGAEAPRIAEFFVRSSCARYIQAAHPIEMLAYDLQKLRTEYRTGNRITRASAEQAEVREHHQQLIDKLVREGV